MEEFLAKWFLIELDWFLFEFEPSLYYDMVSFDLLV